MIEYTGGCLQAGTTFCQAETTKLVGGCGDAGLQAETPVCAGGGGDDGYRRRRRFSGRRRLMEFAVAETLVAGRRRLLAAAAAETSILRRRRLFAVAEMSE